MQSNQFYDGIEALLNGCGTSGKWGVEGKWHVLVVRAGSTKFEIDAASTLGGYAVR